MDWVNVKNRTYAFLREYKFVAIILLAGLILMLLPTSKKESKTNETVVVPAPASESLQDSLAVVLSSMEGAGKVKVLLTQAQGEQIIYQTDVEEQENEMVENTVIISGSGKEQRGLVKQTLPPKYLGAVVLCQGADKAAIRLAIVEAVSSATGLSTDRITVLKMK